MTARVTIIKTEIYGDRVSIPMLQNTKSDLKYVEYLWDAVENDGAFKMVSKTPIHFFIENEDDLQSFKDGFFKSVPGKKLMYLPVLEKDFTKQKVLETLFGTFILPAERTYYLPVIVTPDHANGLLIDSEAVLPVLILNIPSEDE